MIMKIHFTRLLHVIIGLVLSGITSESMSQIEFFSGFESGSNYQIAKEIASVSSKSIDVKISNGSVDNFEKLQEGKIALLQYDVLREELANDFKNNTTNTDDVRVLLPMGTEEIHLIARSTQEKPINSYEDLKNEDIKVAVGAPGQGTYVTIGIIKKLTKAHWIDVELSFSEALQALLKGEIQALFFVGAAPVYKLERLAKLHPHEQKPLRLIELTDPNLAGSYAKATIESGIYKWADYRVETFAVRSLLVTKIGETPNPDFGNALRTLLIDIKANIIKLQKEGHKQWRRINFNYSEINWDIHEEANKLFIEKQKKNNGK